MNVLFVSNGYGLGMAWKILREDHRVVISGMVGESGVGLYEKVGSWRTGMKDADFVIFDSPGSGNKKGVLNSRGCKVFCCDPVTDLLHSDLKRQHQLFRAMGVETNSRIADTEFVVQGFFDGRDFAKPLIVGVEVQKFMAGDLGIMTDSMGCVCRALPDGDVNDAVLNAVPLLKKLGFKGIITFGMCYNEDILNGTAVSCGFHYDVSEAVAEGLRGNLLDVLYFTSQGMLQELNLTDDVMVAIRFTTPPWPYPLKFDNKEMRNRIEGLGDHNLPHIFLCDVTKNNGNWYVGETGLALKATARGRTVKEAVRRAYRSLDCLEVEGGQYRNDLKNAFVRRLRNLRDRGIFNGIQY